ncbi:MAG TPA: IS1182 family transposase [Candidatus Binataceae bacterium]|nr:IS1182 family transposase [Candidatus Binataceae bacterium]
MEREVRRLEGLGQLGFAFRTAEAGAIQSSPDEAGLFLDAKPCELFVGAQRLDDYLREAGLGWVLRLSTVLAEVDLAALTRRYQASGRKAFHPRTLLGLIVYGILNRQWSLRELKNLARRDVGAWWLCGGHQPDHSTIGKFIVLHGEILTEEFFVDLVKHLVTRLRLGPTLTAGDGTLLDAAASRFRLLWSEAAEQAAQEARETAAAAPDDAKLKRKAELANAAVQLGADRLARRRMHQGDAAEVKVSLIEPEAVHQRAKDRTRRLAYKPVVLANADGLIVGQRVEPSNEVSAIAPVLDQHRAIFDCVPPTLLLDGGFSSNALWKSLVGQGIDVLCPSGRTDTDGDWQKLSSRPGKFNKREFHYDAARDVYDCPAGRELTFAYQEHNALGLGYREYWGRQCEGCPLRSRCTDSRRGRTLKRYAGEEFREWMAQLLEHPLARARYRRRKVIVEPCFAELRERQGLKRFHRRGLKAVRVEFALHCIAFNLKRAVRRLLLLIICRGPGLRSGWRRQAPLSRRLTFRPA